MDIFANLIDIHARRIFPAKVTVVDGRIESITESAQQASNFLLPGFIDAHIHIESSMVTPVSFSRTAIKHGTVGLVTDPHEIGNVMGVEGVKFMIENAKATPLKILFGAPSCVPATSFESSGAIITSEDISELLSLAEVGFLSEVMNYPGVIYGDEEIVKKIEVAKRKQVPIDGHAPGVRGKDLEKYVGAGISTDHECFTLDEALEKISWGMKILIREGSGARNFDTLLPLLKSHPESVMFCSDDLHPDDLIKGHINLLVKRALKSGYDLFDVLRASGLNAANHYNLEIGMLREKDPADFILVDTLEDFNVLKTYINGESYYAGGEVNIPALKITPVNKFNISRIKAEDIELVAKGNIINVIKAIDGELITQKEQWPAYIVNNSVCSDLENDVLKIVVVNRYIKSSPAIAFIKGFGLKRGALGSSISHDSHNIICVGVSDEEIAETINWIIDNEGGIAVSDGREVKGFALEVAGIMSQSSVENAAESYSKLSFDVARNGSELKAPFMTLAFMALLVIPDLKLSDLGLFDGTNFSFTSLFVDQE